MSRQLAQSRTREILPCGGPRRSQHLELGRVAEGDGPLVLVGLANGSDGRGRHPLLRRVGLRPTDPAALGAPAVKKETTQARRAAWPGEQDSSKRACQRRRTNLEARAACAVALRCRLSTASPPLLVAALLSLSARRQAAWGGYKNTCWHQGDVGTAHRRKGDGSASGL